MHSGLEGRVSSFSQAWDQGHMLPFEGPGLKITAWKKPHYILPVVEAFYNQPICTLSTKVSPVPLRNVASPVGLAAVLLASIKYY